MASIVEPKRSKEWQDRWNPDVLKRELAKKDRSIRAICRAYATEETGWQGLYLDIKRWRKADPELNQILQNHISEVGKLHGPGKRRFDETPETDGWKVEFCREYAEKASKFEASKVTPYKYTTILAKLNPSKSEFDQGFRDMVDAVDAMLADEAVSEAMDSMREAKKQQLDPKTRAWIALGIARIAKGSEWSQQKIDVTHKGTIKFEAQRAMLQSDLAAEQRARFANNRAHLLPSGERNEMSLEPAMEAELVETLESE